MAGYIASFRQSLQTLLKWHEPDLERSQASVVPAPVKSDSVTYPKRDQHKLELGPEVSSAAKAEEKVNMANILVDVEKGIEVAAEDVLKYVNGANAKVASGGPSAIAGIAVVAGAVDKALSDVAAGAANPTTLVLNFGTDVADIKAVWPAVKGLLTTFGVKI
jgi:hypothetical protein